MLYIGAQGSGSESEPRHAASLTWPRRVGNTRSAIAKSSACASGDVLLAAAALLLVVDVDAAASMSSPPYILIPYTDSPAAPPPQRLRPSFPLLSTIAGTGPAPSPTAFRAPAHRHAHHLHSIPPREKSTRTLIIDHMLWAHGRTRFAQARAELGMSDLTGGSASAHYVHRERPENFPEDDEARSDGEDTTPLKARTGASGPERQDEQRRFYAQDLVLASVLRHRAESLEKVITSMLEQPPEVRPAHNNDLYPPKPEVRRAHPHTLPDGVRLRLALATVVNDLFSREAPVPVPRPVSSYSFDPAAHVSTALPEALVPLSALATPTPTTQISPRAYSLLMAGAYPTSPSQCARHLRANCTVCSDPSPQQGHGLGLGLMGLGSNANMGSPRSSTGWNGGGAIAASPTRNSQSRSVLRRRAGSVSTGASSSISPLSNSAPSSLPASLGVRPKGKGVVGVHAASPFVGTSLASGNTPLVDLLPRFLRLSALLSMELAREAKEDRDSVTPAPAQASGNMAQVARDTAERREEEEEEEDSEAGDDGRIQVAWKPDEEWYLLFAGLATRAVLEGYTAGGWRGSQPAQCIFGLGTPGDDSAESTAGDSDRSLHGGTSGVGDRKGVGGDSRRSGVNSSDRKGGDAATSPISEAGDRDDEFLWFEPDELPGLKEAMQVLFPREQGDSPEEIFSDPQAEFESEMLERSRKFFDVLPSTPDLSTHLKYFSSIYPADSVERAALRFCEAVGKWRGKPELEGYKKYSAPGASPTSSISSSSSVSLSFHAFVHSNPASPTTSTVPILGSSASAGPPATPSEEAGASAAVPTGPPIKGYFRVPIVKATSPAGLRSSPVTAGEKRQREDEWSGSEGTPVTEKRAKVD